MEGYGPEKSFGGDSLHPHPHGESSRFRSGLGRRVLDSFKRDPNTNMPPGRALGSDGKIFDVESAAQNTATSPLARRLKGRHLQMIAIGGSIGMCDLPFKTFVQHFNHMYRYWLVCRIWTGTCEWRTGQSGHRILCSRSVDVLHRPGPR
jgi:hypothetical protein